VDHERADVGAPTGRRGLAAVLPAVATCAATAGILGGIALLSSAATPGAPLPRVAAAPPAGSRPAVVTVTPPTRRPSLAAKTRRPRRKPKVTAVAPAASPAATARGTPSPRARGSGIAVTYVVDSQWSTGFQGQVEIVNYGKRPVSGWQIVIALRNDVVRSFSGATGYASNGILLLHPRSRAEVVPPGGGALSVTFVASGTDSSPLTCAFNGILCG